MNDFYFTLALSFPLNYHKSLQRVTEFQFSSFEVIFIIPLIIWTLLKQRPRLNRWYKYSQHFTKYRWELAYFYTFMGCEIWGYARSSEESHSLEARFLLWLLFSVILYQLYFTLHFLSLIIIILHVWALLFDLSLEDLERSHLQRLLDLECRIFFIF